MHIKDNILRALLFPSFDEGNNINKTINSGFINYKGNLCVYLVMYQALFQGPHIYSVESLHNNTG